ncbi:MAG: hypothetical protein ACK4GO_16830 [Gemmobacter sp.]
MTMMTTTTTQQPTTGPGLRIVPKDCSPDAVTARIAQFCAWFGVQPVKLKVRKGKVYLTDDLLGWVIVNGASLDWIIGGDPIVMMAICRDALLRETIAKVEARRAKMAEGAETKQDEHAA